MTYAYEHWTLKKYDESRLKACKEKNIRGPTEDTETEQPTLHQTKNAIQAPRHINKVRKVKMGRIHQETEKSTFD